MILFQARANITEVHFLPFNPVLKRTAITYIDDTDGRWFRVSKGAPEQVSDSYVLFIMLIIIIFSIGCFIHACILQILALSHNSSEIEERVHAVIDRFADRGLRSLAVAQQVLLILSWLILTSH